MELIILVYFRFSQGLSGRGLVLTTNPHMGPSFRLGSLRLLPLLCLHGVLQGDALLHVFQCTEIYVI